MNITPAALEIRKNEGFKEVRIEGKQGSGKTKKIHSMYRAHDLVLIEEGHDFERWLVRPRKGVRVR